MLRPEIVEGIDYAVLTDGDIAMMRAAMAPAVEIDLSDLFIEEEDAD